MKECKVCASQEELIKAKDEEGNIVYICSNCYEGVCEGYEKVDEEELEKGGD
jgi:hypothetical protein